MASRETFSNGVYCKHILEAIGGIEDFISGMSYTEFSHDLKTILAVSIELEIIGEASKRLSVYQMR